LCIIHRVLELQAFLVDLIDKFEFSLAVPAESIRREGSIFMVPTIEGQVEKGAQLPFTIQLAAR
jgi:hypothetical protein